MIKFDQIGRSVSDANDANGQPHILLVGMIIPNIWKNKKNVLNHQPDILLFRYSNY